MASARLPANQIIGEAYGFVFANLRPLARAAAVPCAIKTLFLLRAIWAAQEGGMATYAVVLWTIIEFAATIPYQTQCYRFAVAITSDSEPRLGWPWGRRETMFVLNALGLAVIGMLCVAFLALVALLMSDGPQATESVVGAALYLAVFMLPTAVIGLYAGARISLVFAAAAVGRPTTWRLLWGATVGNGWRLAWTMLITALPWIFAAGAIQMLAGPQPGVALLIGLGLLGIVLELIGVAVSAVALGFAYRRLVPASLGRPGVSLLV